MPRIALKSALVKKISPAYMMPTKRLLFDIDDSASIVHRRDQHLQQREQRDGRQQEDVVADEGEAAGEHDLDEQQQDRRQPGDADEEQEQDRQLAGDVLGARERLRQVDLQGVGAAIVGDEPGADVDGDEEDEDALLAEELAEGLGLRRRGTTPAEKFDAT